MAFETFAVHAACIRGVEAIPVTVEVSLAGGVPGIQMLGIPSMEVMESRGRIRCAMRSAGFEIPRSGITVNLAPGDIRKTGSGFDLPIAIAVLAADGQIPRDNLDRCLIAGELGLDGTVLPVKGEVAFQLLARDMGLSFIAGRSDQHVPLAGVSCGFIDHLSQLAHGMGDAARHYLDSEGVETTFEPELDYADVLGQEVAKRMTGILPELSVEDQQEALCIHSVLGENIDGLLAGHRPFRSPHHSASSAALAGGGAQFRPGECSLANCGVLFLDGGKLGTLFLDPLVSDPAKLVDIMQINFLQPIYNLTFSNSLVACVVFLGVGAMCEIGFILANPWTSIIIAIFAECGTFVTLVLGVHLGLTPPEAAAVASIGGADGPMVLFTSLMLAPHLFVPISVIAYLYLSLTYAGYPWLVKLMVPKALRGKDIMYYAPEVPKSKKFIFILVCCGLLCLLLPMAAPLIMSFFLGMAIKESEIVPYQDLVENTLLYTGTLMLGLLLGTLCEASTLLNPKVAPLIVLGVLALAVSGAVGILGGYVVYWFKKGDFNPVVGIAGVSCVPTTAKIAQHAAEDEDPFSVVMPVAMGANIGGVIVSAIACGVFIATIGLVK